MISVEEQIALHAQLFPDKVALVSGDLTVSYKDMWENCLRAANGLVEHHGIRKGDRVLVAASGEIGFVYAYFGIHLAGGICVAVDPDTNQRRFDLIRQSTDPRCILGRLHLVPDVETCSFDELLADATPFPLPSNLDDVADILFTTGTTGTPKGVCLSYKNLAAAANNINTFIGNTREDIELLALPVSHSFGLGRMRCVLVKGGTLVMLGTFANVKRFFGEVKRCGVTGFGMVPASWGFIKKMSGRYIGKFADQLRYIEIGSAFMPVEDKKLLMELLPHTRINMHYGLTEASRSAFMEFHEEKDNLTTAGKASPNVDIRIIDDEVCVKGEHVCIGYWNESEERFRQDFHGDYFRTGDTGTMDAEGRIYLKSRIKEMINVGGKKVAPMEVEEQLNAIPGIIESACIGVADPDGVMGEVVKAFIVTEGSDISDDTILSLLRPRLENYKVPVFIERIPELPKTASGKIQRLLLK